MSHPSDVDRHMLEACFLLAVAVGRVCMGAGEDIPYATDQLEAAQ